MFRRWFGRAGNNGKEYEGTPTSPAIPLKTLSPEEGSYGEIQVVATSPSVDRVIQLMTAHAAATKKNLSLEDYHFALQRVFSGLEISDLFVNGQIAGELAGALAPPNTPLTGLEGYFLGISPENYADFVLEIGAALKDEAGYMEYRRVMNSSGISPYANGKAKDIQAIWRFASSCRSIVTRVAAQARQQTRVGFDPQHVSVSIPHGAVSSRIIRYTGAGIQLREQQIPGMDQAVTSQAYFLLNIGSRLGETPSWINAWQHYPDEMQLAQVAGHIDSAVIGASVEEYMRQTHNRFY